MAPPGSHKCDFGESVARHECEAASEVFMRNNHPDKNMAVGSGGTCLDGGFGEVPLGCSLQHSGRPHYKTSGDSGKDCISSGYQLVCRLEGPFSEISKMIQYIFLCTRLCSLINSYIKKWV